MSKSRRTGKSPFGLGRREDEEFALDTEHSAEVGWGNQAELSLTGARPPQSLSEDVCALLAMVPNPALERQVDVLAQSALPAAEALSAKLVADHELGLAVARALAQAPPELNDPRAATLSICQGKDAASACSEQELAQRSEHPAAMTSLLQRLTALVPQWEEEEELPVGYAGESRG